MTRSSAALVIVDAQNGFVSDHSKHVIPVIADLVSQWQANGGDTIFTRYSNYPGSPFERLLSYTELRTTPDTDIVDELLSYANRATSIIDKTIYSLFNDAGSAVVRDHGWTDLYICGIDTECCVLKTAVDAFERNLTPWVIVDACASHSGLESHNAGLLVATNLIGSGQLIQTTDMPILSTQ